MWWYSRHRNRDYTKFWGVFPNFLHCCEKEILLDTWQVKKPQLFTWIFTWIWIRVIEFQEICFLRTRNLSQSQNFLSFTFKTKEIRILTEKMLLFRLKFPVISFFFLIKEFFFIVNYGSLNFQLTFQPPIESWLYMKVKWFSFMFQLNLNYCILSLCVCVCVCVGWEGVYDYILLWEGYHKVWATNIVLILSCLYLKKSNFTQNEIKTIEPAFRTPCELVTTYIFPTSSPSFFHQS